MSAHKCSFCNVIYNGNGFYQILGKNRIVYFYYACDECVDNVNDSLDIEEHDMHKVYDPTPVFVMLVKNGIELKKREIKSMETNVKAITRDEPTQKRVKKG